MLRTKEETDAVGKRGMAIYERDIAPQLTDEDRGRYIAIDVNTGEWEIDDTRDASSRLRSRVPDADILVLTHIDISTGYVGGIPRGVFD